MGRQKTYNDQLENEVIELLKKGKPLAYISDKTGLGVTPIRNIKSSLGLVNKRKVPTENIAALMDQRVRDLCSDLIFPLQKAGRKVEVNVSFLVDGKEFSYTDLSTEVQNSLKELRLKNELEELKLKQKQIEKELNENNKV